jgi:hypothetical protein
MSSLTTSADFANLKGFDDLKRWITIWARDVESQINGNLDFTSNIRCKIIDYTFVSPNTEYGIAHNLRKVPTGYILVNTDLATVLYNGGSTNTDSLIYLKCSVVTTCKILVF